MGIAQFRLANMVWGFDVLSSLVIGTMPLAAITLFVQVLVNGKPPSHTWDVMCWGLWRGHGLGQRGGRVGRRPPLLGWGEKTGAPRPFLCGAKEHLFHTAVFFVISCR